MIMKYKQGDKIAYEICEYYIDTENELSQIIPTAPGCSAYVITTGEYWIVGSDKKWYPKSDPSKEPVECDCVEESTIWGWLPEV